LTRQEQDPGPEGYAAGDLNFVVNSAGRMCWETASFRLLNSLSSQAKKDVRRAAHFQTCEICHESWEDRIMARGIWKDFLESLRIRSCRRVLRGCWQRIEGTKPEKISQSQVAVSGWRESPRFGCSQPGGQLCTKSTTLRHSLYTLVSRVQSQ